MLKKKEKEPPLIYLVTLTEGDHEPTEYNLQAFRSEDRAETFRENAEKKLTAVNEKEKKRFDKWCKGPEDGPTFKYRKWKQLGLTEFWPLLDQEFYMCRHFRFQIEKVIWDEEGEETGNESVHPL